LANTTAAATLGHAAALRAPKVTPNSLLVSASQLARKPVFICRRTAEQVQLQTNKNFEIILFGPGIDPRNLALGFDEICANHRVPTLLATHKPPPWRGERITPKHRPQQQGWSYLMIIVPQVQRN
jgi:hypothetical protein